MNCAEYQELLPEIIDGSDSPEYTAHANSCPECSSLYSELKEISQVAMQLRAGEEPSQRVWNSIEIALRQEGFIHEPLAAGPSLVPARISRWKLGWLVPVAALLLVMSSGVVIYQHRAQPQPVADMSTPPSATNRIPAEDQAMLQEVSAQAPALRANYAADLDHVNSYIQAAQASLQEDPTDEEAQRALMQAYEQRSMVYEMAFERSVP
jgi:hypothetical protein